MQLAAFHLSAQPRSNHLPASDAPRTADKRRTPQNRVTEQFKAADGLRWLCSDCSVVHLHLQAYVCHVVTLAR